MTPTQKRLVQDTFAQVAPISETAAKLFYDRLFLLDPTLRPLFKGDMQEQGRKLTQMIAVAVGGLDDLDLLRSAIRALGRRHAGYGFQPAHYDTVATALLWTLEQGLGDAFTPEAREAWATVYGILAGTMLDGAAEPLARTA